MSCIIASGMTSKVSDYSKDCDHLDEGKNCGNGLLLVLLRFVCMAWILVGL